MQYCKRCVMPSTRPGITFDSEGICCACRAHEKKLTVDWDERYKELEALCNKYRGMNGDMEHTIRDVIASHAKDGNIDLSRDMRMGILIWEV